MKWGGEKKMASREERFKGWVALYSLTGWVRKDVIHPLTVSGSQHRQSDRNTMLVCSLRVFWEIFIRPRVKGCKWISAWEEKKRAAEMEKGDFVAECPLTGKYCIIIILFSGTCSNCSNSLSLSPFPPLCSDVSCPFPSHLNHIIAYLKGRISNWTNCTAPNCTKGREWPLACFCL